MFTLFQALILPGGFEIRSPAIIGNLRLPALGTIISAVYEVILIIAGILTFIWLIIGGFRLLFSGGDPKNIAGARDNITFALIGFVIIFGAWWLTLIIQRALGLCIVGWFIPLFFFAECP